MYTLSSLPKRRFARYWLQPVPAGSKTVEGKNIKARGTRTYKPKEPAKQDNFYENKNEEKKVEKPQNPPRNKYPPKGQPGSSSNPFKNRTAARRAGYKRGDRVWYIRQNGAKRGMI